jgi:hypothetical protein
LLLWLLLWVILLWVILLWVILLLLSLLLLPLLLYSGNSCLQVGDLVLQRTCVRMATVSALWWSAACRRCLCAIGTTRVQAITLSEGV